MQQVDIGSLEKAIGYKFSNEDILIQALTHSSYANELKAKKQNAVCNERLEFLGDSVLEIVVSEYLYENCKKKSEGTLTKMRQHLVCEKTLAKIAAELSIGDYINLGRGEELTDCRKRPKVLADALEAVFAAVYLDSGKNEKDYKRVILTLVEPEIENAFSMKKGDYKTQLQQLIEQDGSATLEYKVIEETGPEHDKTFTVVAVVNNNAVGTGTSKSKKDAEMQAAKVALSLFGVGL